MQDGGSQILDNIIANIQFTSTGDIQQTITAPAKVLFITFRRQPSTCPQQSGSSIHTALAFPWGFQQITSGDTPKSEGTTAGFITEYLKCCCVIPPKSDSIILYWTFYKSGKQGERNTFLDSFTISFSERSNSKTNSRPSLEWLRRELGAATSPLRHFEVLSNASLEPVGQNLLLRVSQNVAEHRKQTIWA